MTRYGVRGAVSRELLSYGGRVLVHDNVAELEFLLPGQQVVRIPRSIPVQDTLPLTAHPELSSVRFPLSRKDFR